MDSKVFDHITKQGALRLSWDNKTGCELGDLVEITNNPCQETLNLQGKPKASPGKLPIVGFATVRNQQFAIVKHAEGGVWYKINTGDCEIHELDNAVKLTDSLYFVHIRDIKSLTKSQKENSNMSKPGLIDTVKDDAVDGAYRAAGRKSKKMVQDAAVKAFEKVGVKGNLLGAVADFFGSDFGRSAIGYGLGEALPLVPKVGKTKQATKLAKEYRVDSLAEVETMVLDTVLSAFGPTAAAAKDLIKNLPKEEEDSPKAKPQKEIVTVGAGSGGKKAKK